MTQGTPSGNRCLSARHAFFLEEAYRHVIRGVIAAAGGEENCSNAVVLRNDGPTESGGAYYTLGSSVAVSAFNNGKCAWVWRRVTARSIALLLNTQGSSMFDSVNKRACLGGGGRGVGRPRSRRLCVLAFASRGQRLVW